MRAKGIDLSHWQKTFEPQGNIDFVIQKVSEGLAKDALYNQLLPAVKTIERRGGYHYFRTEVDPIAQAEFFYRAQAGQGFKWLAVDCEAENNIIDATSAYNYKLCLYKLSELTDKPILAYTSPYLYRDNLLANYPTVGAYPLWMAYYGDGVNEPDYENDNPLFANDWTFWQWEADGNGKGSEYGVGSDDVCLDVFNGTVAELDDWLDVVDPPVGNCDELIAEAVTAARIEEEEKCQDKIDNLNAVHQADLIKLQKTHALVLEASIKKAHNDALKSLIQPLLMQ